MSVTDCHKCPVSHLYVDDGVLVSLVLFHEGATLIPQVATDATVHRLETVWNPDEQLIHAREI